MRIAFVTPGLLPLPPVLGGAEETYVDQLTRVLTSLEITVYSEMYTNWARVEQRGNIKHIRYQANNWQQYLQRVCQHLAKSNFQLIQVENRPGFVPSVVQANPNSKVILNLHSLDFVKNDNFIVYPIGFCLEKADLITVNSDYIGRELKEMFPGLGTPVVTIHMGTNPDKILPRWEPNGLARRKVLRKKLGVNEKKVVLCADSVLTTKGIHVLLRAMRVVAQRYPKCVLLIVGRSKLETRKLTAYMKKLQTQKSSFKTEILKFVDHKHMPNYYLAADLLVSLSNRAEASGLQNIEAMATGLPVIGSDIGGIPEVIISNQSGLLVKPNCHLSLSRAICSLLGKPAIAARMGRVGRQKVEEYFNWNRVGKQMQERYATLIHKNVRGEAVAVSQCIYQVITPEETVENRIGVD